MPDEAFKTVWDLIMVVFLFYTFFVTPYRIAFDDESILFAISDQIVDFVFLADIIITFFMAFYNSQFILIDKRKDIAKSYLKSWFIIDVISILPFNLLAISGGNRMLRGVKIPKFYKMIKMLKLVRMLKAFKERDKLTKYITKVIKVNFALDRLIFFLLIFLLDALINWLCVLKS